MRDKGYCCVSRRWRELEICVALRSKTRTTFPVVFTAWSFIMYGKLGVRVPPNEGQRGGREVWVFVAPKIIGPSSSVSFSFHKKTHTQTHTLRFLSKKRNHKTITSGKQKSIRAIITNSIALSHLIF